MKTLSKIALAYVLLLASCSAFRVIDMNKVSVGMDKETAYKSLGKTPDATIVVKQYPQGTLEVVEYTLNVLNSAGVANDTAKPGRYWLYFFNNKLVQYGRPGNLEEQEDHILSMQQTKQ